MEIRLEKLSFWTSSTLVEFADQLGLSIVVTDYGPKCRDMRFLAHFDFDRDHEIQNDFGANVVGGYGPTLKKAIDHFCQSMQGGKLLLDGKEIEIPQELIYNG